VTAPISDPQQLPGTDVIDQVGVTLGPVKHLYAPGGEGEPMWVSVELRTGMLGKRTVVVPLARLKEEDGKVVLPYSIEHVEEAPEVDPDGEISVEEDHRLREYYGIGRGDEPEPEKNPDLYSMRLREDDAPSERLEPSAAEESRGAGGGEDSGEGSPEANQ
jgi:hypothetical protein